VIKEDQKIAFLHAWRKHRFNFITLMIFLVYYLLVMRELAEYGRGAFAMWLLLTLGIPTIILLMLRDFIRKLRELKDGSNE
jgi:hypothetical protein